jgi:hypothetical protein
MVNPFSKLFGPRKLEEPTTKQVIEVHTESLGTTGTEIYSGYINEEYLDSLRYEQRADVYDQMRRTDYQIKMCLQAVMNPIKDAVWRFEAASDEPEHVKQAEFMQHVLENMDKSWDEVLPELLTVLIHGHCVHEIIHKAVVKDADFGSYIGIRSMSYRSQRTIERFNVEPKTGNLLSITQQADGDLAFYGDIPAQFLLVLSLEKEGSNYEGISLLRSAYGPYVRKATYMKLNAIGIEKFAVPTPVASYPAEQQDKAQYNQMKQVLQRFVTSQQQYIIHPKGWEIELKSNSYDPQKVEMSIDAEDKRIAKAFTANFLELGMGTTGSYSLSNDLSDFFLGGIKHIAYLICGSFNKKITKDLIDLNFGPQSKYPKLCAEGISDKAGKELAEVLGILSSRKIIIPDDKLEDTVRDRYDLPARSDEGQRDVTPKTNVSEFSEKPKSMFGQWLKLQERHEK